MSDNPSEPPKTAMQIAAALSGDVYKDGLKPSVETTGKALDGILKAISHYPRYWGMMSDISLEYKQEAFRKKLDQKFSSIPPEDRVLPKPSIVGPAIQALEYAIFDDDISDMFANLLAASATKESGAHPAFVEIIKNMNHKEAQFLALWWELDNKRKGGSIIPSEEFIILRTDILVSDFISSNFLKSIEIHHGLEWIGRGLSGFFLKQQHQKSISGWFLSKSIPKEKYESVVDNLTRLGIFEMKSIKGSVMESRTEQWIEILLNVADLENKTIGLEGKLEGEIILGEQLEITSFGRHFVKCCIERSHPYA